MADAAIENLAVILLAGLAAGWLAGMVTRGSGFGLPGNLLLALRRRDGGALCRRLDRPRGGRLVRQAAAAVLGAFGLLYIVAAVRR